MLTFTEVQISISCWWLHSGQVNLAVRERDMAEIRLRQANETAQAGNLRAKRRDRLRLCLRYPEVKTARFAHIVEECGQPEIYLLLEDPARDAKFQKAVRAQRVMTVYQSTRGHHADRAEVAFEPGTKRQFLIFPKSLKRFAGSRVVGIKYELMQSGENLPGRHAAKPKRSPSRPPLKAQAHPPPEKVVDFPSPHRPPSQEEEEEESEAVAEIKAQIRHAMDYLERGRSVAAFNLLQRIVDG